jgi:hypothetical protein
LNSSFLKRESCKSHFGPETAQISKGGEGKFGHKMQQ